MAYVLLFFGFLLTVAGVRAKHNELFSLLADDFSGSNSFIYWIAAIALIGAVGYAPGMKGLSNAFLALILIVLVLSQGQGLFDKFGDALKRTEAPVNPSTKTQTAA